MPFLARLLKDISECISQDVELRLSDFLRKSPSSGCSRLVLNLQRIN